VLNYLHKHHVLRNLFLSYYHHPTTGYEGRSREHNTRHIPREKKKKENMRASALSQFWMNIPDLAEALRCSETVKFFLRNRNWTHKENILF